MIDTIEFRLNHVSNYNLIKSQFEGSTKVGATTFTVDEDTGECFNATKIRAMLFHDSDTIVPLTKRSSIYIASSHYNLSYVYNAAQDYLEFNFAVPKYKYGTNILQFIRYNSQSCETTYELLNQFINEWVKKHFLQEIDFADLELRRLDLCYNQFFNSKNDALTYLSEQKELLKKHARSTKNDYRNYETSLMYMTKRYSFKIYHKGTEFKKHDKKELIKKNRTGEHLDFLQDTADRILRYEVTFRKAQINYLFEQAQLHNKYLKFVFDSDQHRAMRQGAPQYYADSMKFAEQSKHFVFKKIGSMDAVKTQCVHFSYDVFKTMYDFFWDKVKDYQLKMKLSIHDVVEKIDAINDQKQDISVENKQLRAKLSMHKPTMVALALLTQYYPLDDLRKTGFLPKSTFYKYKAQLAKVGIDSETRLSDMPPPALDYSDYKFIFGRHHLT
jgi:hypothetical protein